MVGMAATNMRVCLVYSKPLVDFYFKYFKFRHQVIFFYTLLYDNGNAYYESAVL